MGAEIEMAPLTLHLSAPLRSFAVERRVAKMGISHEASCPAHSATRSCPGVRLQLARPRGLVSAWEDQQIGSKGLVNRGHPSP